MDNGNKIFDIILKNSWNLGIYFQRQDQYKDKEDLQVRTDQDLLKVSENYSGTEAKAKVSISARDGNEKRDFLDITALIRSIQRAEGNPDCFMKGEDDCDRLDCSWRIYCLGRDRTF